MFNNRVFYKTVDSTNDLLLKLVREKKVEKNTVLIADFQIKGRGQRNKKWHAERDKNLLISLFLKPDNFLTKNDDFCGFWSPTWSPNGARSASKTVKKNERAFRYDFGAILDAKSD